MLRRQQAMPTAGISGSKLPFGAVCRGAGNACRRRRPTAAVLGSGPVQTPVPSNSTHTAAPSAVETDLFCGTGLARRILKANPQIEGDPLQFLKATEAYWKALKHQKHQPHKPGPTVVTTHSTPLPPLPTTPSSSSNSSGAASTSSQGQQQEAAAAAAGVYDVVMAGGTLGLMVAAALQRRGYKVAVVERRRAEGRTQEWNSSRGELEVLLELDLLTREEFESVVATEYSPVRVGFHGGEDLWVTGCLDVGVNPKKLLALLRTKFEAAGGIVYEHTAFKSADVHTDGVSVKLTPARDLPGDVGDANRPTAMEAAAQGSGPSRNPAPSSSNTSYVGNNSVSSSSSLGAGQGGLRAVPNKSSMPLTTHAHSSASSTSAALGVTHWPRLNADGSRNSWATGATISVPLQQQAQLSHSVLNAAGLPPQLASHAGTSSGNGISISSSTSSSSTRPSTLSAPSELRCRLLLDCMGHYSPIVKQMRGKAKPEGMVIVVGGCAEGMPPEANTSADLLYTNSNASSDLQLFWEAFPAEGGAARTTYMFAYTDAHPTRPSFEQFLDAYFALLPEYQGVSLEQLKFKRVLFGGFPSYSNGPLQSKFDRVLQLGDASASQSPLSFGGFGCMLRHCGRLVNAIGQALDQDRLTKGDLALIQPYQPSLAAAWLFQRSMGFKPGQVAPVEAPVSSPMVTQGDASTTQVPQQQQQDVAASSMAESGSHLGPSPTVAPYNPAAVTIGVKLPPYIATALSGCSLGVQQLAQEVALSSRDAAVAAGEVGATAWGMTAAAASVTAARVASSIRPPSPTMAAGARPPSPAANGKVAPTLAAAPTAAGSTPGGAPGTPQPSSSSSSTLAPAPAPAAANVAAAPVQAPQQQVEAPSSSSSSGRRIPGWARLPSNHINALLACNFAVMKVLGQRVMKPFLQDSLQLAPLAAALTGMLFVRPLVIARVLLQVGPRVLVPWFVHFAALAVYTAASLLLEPLRRWTDNYYVHRWLDALKYGASMDYKFHPAPVPPPATAAAAAAAGTAQAPAAAPQPVAAASTAPVAPAAAAAAVEVGKQGVEVGSRRPAPAVAQVWLPAARVQPRVPAPAWVRKTAVAGGAVPAPAAAPVAAAASAATPPVPEVAGPQQQEEEERLLQGNNIVPAGGLAQVQQQQQQATAGGEDGTPAGSAGVAASLQEEVKEVTLLSRS